MFDRNREEYVRVEPVLIKDTKKFRARVKEITIVQDLCNDYYEKFISLNPVKAEMFNQIHQKLEQELRRLETEFLEEEYCVMDDEEKAPSKSKGVPKTPEHRANISAGLLRRKNEIPRE